MILTAWTPLIGGSDELDPLPIKGGGIALAISLQRAFLADGVRSNENSVLPTFMLNRATVPSTTSFQWRYRDGHVSKSTLSTVAAVSCAGCDTAELAEVMCFLRLDAVKREHALKYMRILKMNHNACQVDPPTRLAEVGRRT